MEKFKIDFEKGHTVYKNAEGKRIKGVTTYLGMIDKPALYWWYFKMGKTGQDPRAKKEKAGDIGTIVHAMVLCHFKGLEFDPSNCMPDAVDRAENSFVSFLEWIEQRDITPIAVEGIVISEKYQYGGGFDLVAMEGDKVGLYDFKSGKGIYPSHFWQVAAYWKGYEEVHNTPNDHKIDFAEIVNIPKDEDCEFGTQRFSREKLDNKYFPIFLHAKGIYDLTGGKL